jgi:hypothetical protein
MQVLEATNLTELVQIVEKRFTDGTWMFRGQDSRIIERRRDSIVPHIGRKNARKTASGKEVGRSRYNRDDERRILARFRRQAVPYLTYRPQNDMEWLAVARHHGLPTRLLDWTESALVAAYFATLNMALSD